MLQRGFGGTGVWAAGFAREEVVVELGKSNFRDWQQEATIEG